MTKAKEDEEITYVLKAVSEEDSKKSSVGVGKFIFLEEDNDEFGVFVLRGKEVEVPIPPTASGRMIPRKPIRFRAKRDVKYYRMLLKMLNLLESLELLTILDLIDDLTYDDWDFILNSYDDWEAIRKLIKIAKAKIKTEEAKEP